ncbi:MAG: hypothetical protein WCG92_24885, partial [Hyphomicrobiales bacterium]
MSDLPKAVEICEKGPREGLQIEPGPIPTQSKIDLIDALSETGLKQIQVASFVDARRVPGWADADAVVGGFLPRPGVRYSPLWLNEKGLERALRFKDRLAFRDAILMSASEPFMVRNQNSDTAKNAHRQHNLVAMLKAAGIHAESALIMAAFGCNFAGGITAAQLLDTIQQAFDIAARRAYRVPRPWFGAIRRDLGPTAYVFLLIPFAVYLASYAPWFSSETAVNRYEVGQSIGDLTEGPVPILDEPLPAGDTMITWNTRWHHAYGTDTHLTTVLTSMGSREYPRGLRGVVRDQQDRLEQGVDDLVDPLGDRQRGVEGDRVLHVPRKALGEVRHGGLDLVGHEFGNFGVGEANHGFVETAIEAFGEVLGIGGQELFARHVFAQI